MLILLLRDIIQLKPEKAWKNEKLFFVLDELEVHFLQLIQQQH
jgi:hypothetical protein